MGARLVVQFHCSYLSLKSTILSYLKWEGLEKDLPHTSDNFCSSRRNAICRPHFGDDRELVIGTMMYRLNSWKNRQNPEKRIRQITGESSDVRLLMTFPGIDYHLAL